MPKGVKGSGKSQAKGVREPEQDNTAVPGNTSEDSPERITESEAENTISPEDIIKELQIKVQLQTAAITNLYEIIRELCSYTGTNRILQKRKIPTYQPTPKEIKHEYR